MITFDFATAVLDAPLWHNLWIPSPLHSSGVSSVALCHLENTGVRRVFVRGGGAFGTVMFSPILRWGLPSASPGTSRCKEPAPFLRRAPLMENSLSSFRACSSSSQRRAEKRDCMLRDDSAWEKRQTQIHLTADSHFRNIANLSSAFTLFAFPEP